MCQRELSPDVGVDREGECEETPVTGRANGEIGGPQRRREPTGLWIFGGYPAAAAAWSILI